jgi:hypothetical protein
MNPIERADVIYARALGVSDDLSKSNHRILRSAAVVSASTASETKDREGRRE